MKKGQNSSITKFHNFEFSNMYLKFKRVPLWLKYLGVVITLVIIAIGIGYGVKSFIVEVQKEPPYERFVINKNALKNTRILSKEKNMFAPWKGAKVQGSKTTNLDCYFEKTDGTFVGSYEYEAQKKANGDFLLNSRGYRNVTKDNIIVNGIAYPSEKYIEDYGRKNREILYMICNGPTKFVNQYPEIVSPKEWYEFVGWFLSNVSYGPEIYDLESFTISRGFKEDNPGVITLGGYSNLNREEPSINFYPDGFYGFSPIYNLYNSAYASSLTSVYVDPRGRTEFTKFELEGVLRNIFTKIAIESGFRTSGFPKFSPAIIAKASLLKNKDNKLVQYYKVYIEKYGGLIKEVEKKYPYLFTKVSESINYVWNPNTHEFDFKVKNLASCEAAKLDLSLTDKEKEDECNITTISINRGISTALIIKTLSPDYEFNNVFLLYTAMHEYFHHFTLTSAKKLSKDSVFLGAFDKFKGPILAEEYNLETLNEYFAARNPVTQAYKTPQGEVRFKVDNVPETEVEIFGPHRNKYDSEKRIFEIGSTQEGNRGRALRNWASLKELDKNHLVSVILRNSFDNYAGTLNPSIIGNNTLMVLDKNNNFVYSKNSVLKTKGFNLRTSYKLTGFTGATGGVDRLLNAYPVSGLFDVLQERHNSGPYKYLDDWLYYDLPPESVRYIPYDKNGEYANKLSIVLNSWATRNIATYGDVGKSSRSIFMNYRKNDGSIEQFYIRRPISFHSKTYKNLPLTFTALSGLLTFNPFDGLQTTRRVSWQNFLKPKAIRISATQTVVAISLTTQPFNNMNFRHISAWPIKAPYKVANNRIWLTPASFFETISKKPFLTTDKDKLPSIDNADPNVLDVPLLRTQLAAIRREKLNEANNLQKKVGETDKSFQSRKDAIIKAGETTIKSYFSALQLLFSFVKKDIVISKDVSEHDENGNVVIKKNAATTSAWENVKSEYKSNVSVLNKIKESYGQYPKWYSQVYYYGSIKITVPRNDQAKGLNYPPQKYLDASNPLEPQVLQVSNGGVNKVIKSIRKANFVDELGSMFANYTTLYPEVLVRDFLQICYVPSRKQLIPEKYAKLAKLDKLDISEATTGQTLHVPSVAYRILFADETDAKGNITRKKYVLGASAIDSKIIPKFRELYSTYYNNIVDKSVNNQFVHDLTTFLATNPTDKEIDNFVEKRITTDNEGLKLVPPFKNLATYLKAIKRLDKISVKTAIKNAISSSIVDYNAFVQYANAIYSPSVRGVFAESGLSLSQGYFTDKWARDQMKWDLYNQDKTSAVNGATAYWNFLKNMQDVGETWISGITRKKSTDAIHFYGYFPKAVNNKIKYLVFKNTITNAIHKIPIFKNVGNFHYLSRAVDNNSKITIEQQGYFPWISAAFVVGRFSNAVLVNGQYYVYFEDANGVKIKAEFNRKDKTYVVSENGKKLTTATTYLIHDETNPKNPTTTYVIKEKFGS